MTLILVRHGETAWNRAKRLQGQTDVPLSEVGREQAALLARRFQTTGSGTLLSALTPQSAYSSDLRRASETAQIVLAALPVPLPLQTTPLLRERAFGWREGLDADEMRARRTADPTLADDDEPLTAVWSRMNAAYALIWKTVRETVPDAQSHTALIFGHGASLRQILARAVGGGPETARHFHLDNTGVCMLAFSGTDPHTADGRVLLVNDTAHLTPGW